MIRRKELRFFVPIFLFFFEVLSFTIAFSRNLPEDEQLIQVSIGAFQDGLYDIAEKQLSLFLKDFPAHGKANDVSYLFARTLLLQGKWKEAKSALSRIIQENKNVDSMDYVLFWMAQTEMKLGNPEMSQKWLLLLTRNYPKFEYVDYAYYHLGCLDIELNRFTLAESSFNKVLLLSKRQALVRGASFWLGVVSLKQNGYEKAILYLKPLWEDSKRVPPSNGKEILFWLSEAQFRLGHFREALLNYQTYYNQFRTDPLIPHSLLANGVLRIPSRKSKRVRGPLQKFSGPIQRESSWPVYPLSARRDLFGLRRLFLLHPRTQSSPPDSATPPLVGARPTDALLEPPSAETAGKKPIASPKDFSNSMPLKMRNR